MARKRYVQTRPDGKPTKWDFMSPAQMQSLANTPFVQSDWDPETGETSYRPGRCSGCGHPLPNEAEFAKHFVVDDIRYLNLGHCPDKRAQ